jgi:hypothetical protein
MSNKEIIIMIAKTFAGMALVLLGTLFIFSVGAICTKAFMMLVKTLW